MPKHVFQKGNTFQQRRKRCGPLPGFHRLQRELRDEINKKCATPSRVTKVLNKMAELAIKKGNVQAASVFLSYTARRPAEYEASDVMAAAVGAGEPTAVRLVLDWNPAEVEQAVSDQPLLEVIDSEPVNGTNGHTNGHNVNGADSEG